MLCDLLVHVDGSSAGRRRVQFAVDLALQAGARLNGMHVTPPAEVPPRYKPSQVDRVFAALSTKLALDAQAATVIFSEETHGRLANTRWFEAKGDVVKGICNRARYVDCVIVGQYESQGSPVAHPLPIAHSVVLQCGRPVLVVPANVQTSSLAKTLIAWDGSREAVRAVHDALPLLHLSQSVHIVTMKTPSTEGNEIHAENLVEHLANHGIKIAAHVLHIKTHKEQDLLHELLTQGHYDMLVMGGYSRPKWLEFIFGGVTQSILLSANVLILVSH